MQRAKDIAWGLMANFNTAFPVCSPTEMTCQPYYYNKGHFVWKEYETKEGDNKNEM